jgi:hypothetical protein
MASAVGLIALASVRCIARGGVAGARSSAGRRGAGRAAQRGDAGRRSGAAGGGVRRGRRGGRAGADRGPHGPGRYDPDGALTVVGTWSSTGAAPFSVGTRVELGGRNMATLVFETGRPGRIDHYADATGTAVDLARESGFRSAVGAPITVEGRLRPRSPRPRRRTAAARTDRARRLLRRLRGTHQHRQARPRHRRRRPDGRRRGRPAGLDPRRRARRCRPHRGTGLVGLNAESRPSAAASRCAARPVRAPPWRSHPPHRPQPAGDPRSSAHRMTLFGDRPAAHAGGA